MSTFETNFQLLLTQYNAFETSPIIKYNFKYLNTSMLDIVKNNYCAIDMSNKQIAPIPISQYNICLENSTYNNSRELFNIPSIDIFIRDMTILCNRRVSAILLSYNIDHITDSCISIFMKNPSVLFLHMGRHQSTRCETITICEITDSIGLNDTIKHTYTKLKDLITYHLCMHNILKYKNQLMDIYSNYKILIDQSNALIQTQHGVCSNQCHHMSELLMGDNVSCSNMISIGESNSRKLRDCIGAISNATKQLQIDYYMTIYKSKQYEDLINKFRYIFNAYGHTGAPQQTQDTIDTSICNHLDLFLTKENIKFIKKIYPQTTRETIKRDVDDIIMKSIGKQFTNIYELVYFAKLLLK